jgi:hypothetical protein
MQLWFYHMVCEGEGREVRVKLIIFLGTVNNSVMSIQFSTGKIQVISGLVYNLPPNFVAQTELKQGSKINDTNSTAGILAPDTLVFNFGTLVNNPNMKNTSFTVQGIRQLLDVSSNANGVQLTVIANYTYSDSLGQSSFLILSGIVIVIVSSYLQITKTGQFRNALVQTETIIDFTVTVKHTSTSTSLVFEVQVIDSMIPQMTLLSRTVTAVGGVVVLTENNKTDTTVLAKLSGYLSLGISTIIVTFSANLTTNIFALSPVNSNATTAWLP